MTVLPSKYLLKICLIIFPLKAMEHRVKNGTTPRTLYREHVHTVLLPLDEEESHLLRSLISAAKQFYHYLSLIHHALDGQEAAELITIGNSLNGKVSYFIEAFNHPS